MNSKNSILTAFLALALCTSLAAHSPIFFEGTIAEAKKTAVQESKIFILHFTAQWCLPCRFMEKEVFNHADVVGFLTENAIVYKVDVDDLDAIAIKELYQVKTLPTHILLQVDGQELSRKESSLGVKEYLSWVTTYIPLNHAERSNKNRVSALPTANNTNPSYAFDHSTAVSDTSKENTMPSERLLDDLVIGENYYVQVGVFSQWANAEKLSEQLKQHFKFDTQIFEEEQQGKKLYKIALGSFETKEEAELFADILHKEKLQAVVKKLF